MDKVLLVLASLFGPPDSQLPPLSDFDRLPSYDLCDSQLSFLAARRAWLDGQRKLYRDPIYAPYFDDATDDLENRRLPWAVLYEAHGWNATPERMGEDDERRTYPVEARSKMAQRKLAELRTLVGQQDYSGGVMPALVDPRFYWR